MNNMNILTCRETSGHSMATVQIHTRSKVDEDLRLNDLSL